MQRRKQVWKHTTDAPAQNGNNLIMTWRVYIICCLPALCSCGSKNETTKPVIENITYSVYASGVIKAKNQYQAFSAVNGLIKQILVAEGDVVRKGAPLMIISNETAQLNTENARLSAAFSDMQANSDKLNEAALKIDLAKSNMDNNQLLLQRQQTLWSQNIGSKYELEQRELAYKNAVASYKSAQIEYQQLKRQLNFFSMQSKKNLQISSSIAREYIIKSKCDGRVYNILKETGEMVNIQMPIAIIGDTADFLAELQVDEYDIAQIRQGERIAIKMDSYRGEVFEAVVTKISPIMNDRTRTFTIEADFITKPAILYPNLTMEANIIIAYKEKALLLPRSYVLADSLVLLRNGEKRKVSIGLKDYRNVEILEGITANDIVYKPKQ